MDQVRQVLRYHHYAFNTEKTYCIWILRFIRHFGVNRHPRELGAREVETFLSHLATTDKVSASTQRQALNAIIFLYKHVLHIEMDDQIAPLRAKRRPRLPVVMSVGETRSVLNQMQGQHLLMAELLYGAGLRLMECIRLRVNTIDIERGMIYVRLGKGGKDRGVPLPKSIVDKLRIQLARVQAIHAEDIAAGFGEAWLPEGFAKKIGSSARDLGWRYLFSGQDPQHRPAQRKGASPPRARLRAAEGRKGGGASRRVGQTGYQSHVSPQLRHPPFGKWRQHQDRAGIDGPRRCKNHRDIHPRHAKKPEGGDQSPGHPARQVPFSQTFAAYETGGLIKTD
jgi:integrase